MSLYLRRYGTLSFFKLIPKLLMSPQIKKMLSMRFITMTGEIYRTSEGKIKEKGIHILLSLNQYVGNVLTCFKILARNMYEL